MLGIEVLKVIFIALAIIAFFYMLGRIISKETFNINPILTGFVMFNGIFYVIAFPFLLLQGDFRILTGIIVVLSVIGVTYSVIKNRKNMVLKFTDIHVSPITVIMGMLCVAIIVAGIFLLHTDADDSFYVSRTSTVLFTNAINTLEPSTGNVNFAFPKQYATEGYEVMVAIFCRVFQCNAATMYHSVLMIVFFLIHVLVMYEIGKRLFPKKAQYYTILIMLFDIMGGYSVYSQSAFAILRIWQGKSVLVNIIFPILIVKFIDIFYKKKVAWSDSALLFLLLLSGMNVSTVGVYFIPLAYGVFALTYGIYVLIKREDFKQVIKLVYPVLAVLPMVAATFLSLRGDGTITRVTESSNALDYLTLFRLFTGTKRVALFFGISILCYVLICRNEKKYFFGIYSVILLMTVLNPFLCTYVAKYITGVPVYWRMFWLLGSNIVLASFIMDVSLKYAQSAYIGIGLSIAISLIGMKPIFTEEFFQRASNVEKMSPESKLIAETLTEKEEQACKLLVPLDISYDIRQYTGQIQLTWSRYCANAYINEGNWEKVRELYQSVYTEKVVDDSVYESLRYFDTDYIALYEDSVIEDSVQSKLKKVTESGTLSLYQIMY